jgi:16S rRNA (uracil1498-N3)-methyltransferase
MFVALSSTLIELGIGQRFTLDGGEGRHAAAVRRVRVGEQVDVTDGVGLMLRCIVVSVPCKSQVDLDVENITDVAQPTPRLIVVQAIPKGERSDIAVELLTEVGVDVIVPWAAARCVARWDGERVGKGRDKWQRTANEASKQAHRAWFPEVRPLHSTNEVAALVAAADTAVVLHESALDSLVDLELPRDSSDVLLVVGPEGGIADDERAALEKAGALVRRMGPTVMRTSTAGAAAAAALLSRTARWA